MWLPHTEEIIEHTKGNDDKEVIITKELKVTSNDSYKKEDKGKKKGYLFGTFQE